MYWWFSLYHQKHIAGVLEKLLSQRICLHLTLSLSFSSVNLCMFDFHEPPTWRLWVFFALYTVFPHMFAHVSIKHSAYSSLASCLFISASLSKLYTTLLPPLHPKNELIHWLTAYLVYLENLQELINSHTNLSRQSECYLRNMRRILWCRNTARFSLYMIYKLKVCIFYVILHAIQLAIILSSVISA